MENNENTSYWAIVNGLRLGPMTLDELVRLAPAPATPVWRPGLADWVAASSLPELDGCIAHPIPPLPQTPPPPPPAPAAGPVYASAPPATDNAPQDVRPMPPTYLAWSIVTMLVCCIFTGVVAIIYSTKVSARFNMGDYEGAKKASDNAALWIIITVVCGLIAVPFQIVLSLL